MSKLESDIKGSSECTQSETVAKEDHVTSDFIQRCSEKVHNETSVCHRGTDCNFEAVHSKSPLLVINISSPNDGDVALRNENKKDRQHGRSRRRRRSKCKNKNEGDLINCFFHITRNENEIKLLLRKVLGAYCSCISNSVVQHFECLTRGNEGVRLNSDDRPRSLDRRNTCLCFSPPNQRIHRVYDLTQNDTSHPCKTSRINTQATNVSQFEAPHFTQSYEFNRKNYRQERENSQADLHNDSDTTTPYTKSRSKTAWKQNNYAFNKTRLRYNTGSADRFDQVTRDRWSPWNDQEGHDYQNQSGSDVNNDREFQKSQRMSDLLHSHWKDDFYNSRTKLREGKRSHRQNMKKHNRIGNDFCEKLDYEMEEQNINITKDKGSVYTDLNKGTIPKAKVTVIQEKRIRNISIPCNQKGTKLTQLPKTTENENIKSNEFIMDKSKFGSKYDRANERKYGLASLISFPVSEQTTPQNIGEAIISTVDPNKNPNSCHFHEEQEKFHSEMMTSKIGEIVSVTPEKNKRVPRRKKSAPVLLLSPRKNTEVTSSNNALSFREQKISRGSSEVKKEFHPIQNNILGERKSSLEERSIKEQILQNTNDFKKVRKRSDKTVRRKESKLLVLNKEGVNENEEKVVNVKGRKEQKVSKSDAFANERSDVGQNVPLKNSNRSRKDSNKPHLENKVISGKIDATSSVSLNDIDKNLEDEFKKNLVEEIQSGTEPHASYLAKDGVNKSESQVHTDSKSSIVLTTDTNDELKKCKNGSKPANIDVKNDYRSKEDNSDFNLEKDILVKTEKNTQNQLEKEVQEKQNDNLSKSTKKIATIERKPIIIDNETKPSIVLTSPSLVEEEALDKKGEFKVAENKQQEKQQSADEISDEEAKISALKNLLRRRFAQKQKKSDNAENNREVGPAEGDAKNRHKLHDKDQTDFGTQNNESLKNQIGKSISKDKSGTDLSKYRYMSENFLKAKPGINDESFDDESTTPTEEDSITATEDETDKTSKSEISGDTGDEEELEEEEVEEESIEEEEEEGEEEEEEDVDEEEISGESEQTGDEYSRSDMEEEYEKETESSEEDLDTLDEETEEEESVKS